MAKLKGKYTFKEVLDVEGLIAAGELTEYFNFISGYEGNPVQHYVLEHSGMYIEYDYFGTGIYFGYLTPPENTKNLVYYTKWENERFRYVDFGEGVNMSDRLSSWVVANADPVADPQYSIKTSTLTAIANSIRAKTGGSSPILTENMASEIEGIDTAEPWDESFTVKEGAVIENPLQVYIDARGGCQNLFKEANLSDESLDSMMKGIDTSEISVFESMFYDCRKITEIPYFDTQNATNVNYMCYNCQSLKNAPQINAVGLNALLSVFYGCLSLETVPYFDSSTAKQVNYMFYNCLKLINLPTINLEKCTSMNGMFLNCQELKEVRIQKVSQIGEVAFNGCKDLKTIVLYQSDGIVSLYNTSVFNGTPFASGGSGGTVYVPSALIETYQNATNWSTLYAQGTCTFLPIEGSEYE